MDIKKVTRITDYKGIWGLLSLPAGIYCGSCVSTTQKIYFGIDTGNDAVLSSKCSFIVCSPKTNRITAETVFSFIKKLPAESFNSIDVLSKNIYQQDSNLYILNWGAKDRIEVSVYGNINEIFTQENLSALKNLALK